MLYRIKSTLFVLLMAGLISSCAAPAQTAVPSVPTPTLLPPTLVPSKVSAADPGEVVQGFWEAMEAQDLNAAMAFFADDFQLRGSAYLNGKESLLSYIQGRLDAVSVVEIHDLQVEGDTVSFLVDYYSKDSGVLHAKDVKDVMRVQDGKIIYWEIGN